MREKNYYGSWVLQVIRRELLVRENDASGMFSGK